MDGETLGEIIRSHRLALGLTHEDLAARIGDGVPSAEVARLEDDQEASPPRERLARIADALDVPLGDLLATRWRHEEPDSLPTVDAAIRDPDEAGRLALLMRKRQLEVAAEQRAGLAPSPDDDEAAFAARMRSALYGRAAPGI
jgi:transcriptional regulator with XRE-family HTH domain